MDFESILEEILLGRGQRNLKLKPKQEEALQAIVLNGRDCLIGLPTGYGKSLQAKCYIRGQVNCYCCFSFKYLN